MIACTIDKPVPRWQRPFIKMLPSICRYAANAFGHLRGDDLDNAISEVAANAYVAFVRLVRRGKANRANPMALARFAVAQVREGRQVGTRINVRDVSSSYAQRKKRFAVSRFNQSGHWSDALVEDHRTPVLAQVSFRVDFPIWLSRLSVRKRQIATSLALGYSAREVCSRFGISTGRVSQLRRELHLSWNRFQGEAA